MKDTTQDALEDIYQSVSKKRNMFTKASVYREIAKQLNAIAGGGWKYPYISNLHRGVQVESMSDMIQDAIAKLHKKLTKPPRRKPLPNQIAKRTLVIYATLDELHEIQDRLYPRFRALALLNALKECFDCGAPLTEYGDCSGVEKAHKIMESKKEAAIPPKE